MEQASLLSRKSAAMSPPNPTRQCQCAQVTEEVTSQPKSRQQAHTLAGHTERWAATKSSHSHGTGGPQSASSAKRGLRTTVTQASE